MPRYAFVNIQANNHFLVAITALIQFLLWNDRKRAAKTDTESQIVTSIDAAALNIDSVDAVSDNERDTTGKGPKVSGAQYVGTS